MKVVSQLEEPLREAVHPRLRELGRESEGKERRNGLASHGRDIAQSACETAVPDCIRRVPLAAEVHPLEREIRRDERFVSRRQTDDGAIIPDPGRDSRALARSSATANIFNQQFFRKRQSGNNI